MRGEGARALGISTYSSVFGGIMSSLVLMFFAPFLAKQALRFGPPEYFALAILGMSTVVGMASKSMLKNIISGVFALLIATMGVSQQLGIPRFCFGSFYLLDGIPLVPALIGFFGINAVLETSEYLGNGTQETTAALPKGGSFREMILPRQLIKRLFPTWLTSGTIGNVIGVIPGAGMIMAVYMAYSQAVSRHSDKKFGTGIPEGIAAPETANNAVVASSMVPLLSLGVPGNGTSALFLGALMIQGMRPGPLLFRDRPEIAFLLICGFFVANLMMGPLGLLLGRSFAAVLTKIPRRVLSGLILGICSTSCYAINNSIEDLWVMLIFGVMCYSFRKFEIPHSPILLGIILGPMMENSYMQSMSISGGSPLIFVTRPLACVLLILGLILAIVPFFTIRKKKFVAKVD